MLALAHQFSAHNFHVVGTLETRLCRNGWTPAGDFLVITAAAESKGKAGVALWINTQHEYACGHTLARRH
eukprot:2111076-Pyramimonas_sp.AAC.1